MICKSLFIKSKGVFDGRKQWRCQKWFLENSKNFSYTSFDRSGIPFDRSNVLFDRLKRNRELIESGRSSMMKFFIVSIDWEFLSTDRMLISIDWIGVENQSNEAEPLRWISSFFDRSRNRFDRSKALNFEFSLVFD